MYLTFWLIISKHKNISILFTSTHKMLQDKYNEGDEILRRESIAEGCLKKPIK